VVQSETPSFHVGVSQPCGVRDAGAGGRVGPITHASINSGQAHVDCVGHRYGVRQVLTSASLRARLGEVRVLIGRNGAGKTTLLRIAAGLMQPTTGVVFFGGAARLRVSLPQLAGEGLFWLPDHNLFSATMPVGRQLKFFQQQFNGRDVHECAHRCGVADVLDRCPPNLSSGELRRAEVAAAFVRAPKCLIADEPLRGVAPTDADTIGQLLRGLAAEGAAVVLTGHETTHLFGFADHITWCTSGTTYDLGSPVEARHHERFRREYLGERLLPSGPAT